MGKPGCFAPGTKVLMYDGSIKNVEDVKVGDQVMGDDSSPRNVLELCHNYDTMYKIIPTKRRSGNCKWKSYFIFKINWI